MQDLTLKRPTMNTAAFQPAAPRVHPAAPLLRALAVFIGGYLVYRLTGALLDGVVNMPAGARGNEHIVTLTQPVALLAFGLCIYPLALILSATGLKPELLARPRFVQTVIGAVVTAFVSYIALSFYL